MGDTAKSNASNSAMGDVGRPRRILQRIGPVLAGVAAVIILSTATDMVLQTAGAFPPLGEPMGNPRLLFAAIYRSVYAVVGGYIAARLAPDRPMRHALALGVVGFAMGSAGLVLTWGVGSVWYPLTLIASAIPCAWVGGRIREMDLRARARTSEQP